MTPGTTIGLAALGLGLPAALFVLRPLGRRRDRIQEAADDERAALEADKLAALRALHELALDQEAGHLAESDHAALRARYEAQAAAILRRLDALGPAEPPSAEAPAGGAEPGGRAPLPWTRRPAVLAGAGGALLAFGVLVGILVSRFTAPAGPAPAAVSVTAEGGQPIPKAMLEGMLQAAHASLDAGRYQEAIAAYRAVLKRHPDNTDAITHLGVILALAGHVDDALIAFDRALAIDPNYAHALWDKAQLLYERKQDYAGAIATWERFVRAAPTGQDRDQALARLREARSRLAGAPGPAEGAPAGAPVRSTPGSASPGTKP